MSKMNPVKPVCNECGDMVQTDALAWWNTESQQWEMGDLMDDRFTCVECENIDASITWVPVEKQEGETK